MAYFRRLLFIFMAISRSILLFIMVVSAADSSSFPEASADSRQQTGEIQWPFTSDLEEVHSHKYTFDSPFANPSRFNNI